MALDEKPNPYVGSAGKEENRDRGRRPSWSSILTGVRAGASLGSTIIGEKTWPPPRSGWDREVGRSDLNSRLAPLPDAPLHWPGPQKKTERAVGRLPWHGPTVREPALDPVTRRRGTFDRELDF